MYVFHLFGPITTPDDYIAVQREVMFNPDTFTQTVIVSIQNDQMLELPESFAVELQIATNLPRIQIGQNNRSIVTIIEASGPSCPSCLSCPSCEHLHKCRFGDIYLADVIQIIM